MDTSGQYIKMCDCEEIQDKPHTMADGDVYVWQGIIHVWSGWQPHIPEPIIWLPRKDQLQEMISPEGNMYDLLHGIDGYIDFHTNGTCSDPSTMEQLWLAFVMKERYNKQWDGENWKENR